MVARSRASVAVAVTPRPSREHGASIASANVQRSRGEQTAAAVESNLNALESKLDELLATFESIPADAAPSAANGDEKSGAGGRPGTEQKKTE